MQNTMAENAGSAGTFRWAPAVVGLGTFLFVWWMWGSFARAPVNHDEAAYVLQARIFAGGHLVAPARPIPEFFEQYHTFVEPVVAAKYPPGFSLLLVPGLWIGLAGFIPALLAGLSSALLFFLARRLAGGAVALFSAVLATTSDIALHFNASYSSETATASLVLVGWWALMEHWKSGGRRWLLLLALAVGWGAITRPLTMLAYAIPTGVATLVSISRRSDWRAIPYCLGIVGALIAFMIFWDARVTGTWRRSPHAEYARLYIPADRMGFGLQGAAPARTLSGEQLVFKQWVDSLHRDHTPKNLPSIAANRAAGFVIQTWPRGVLGGVLAFVGFLFVPLAVGRVVWGTALLIFASHLLYAHALDWPAYYLELQGPLAFMAAAGVFGLASRIAHVIAETKRRYRNSNANSLLPAAIGDPRIVFALLAFWLLAPTPIDILYHRRALRLGGAYLKDFQSRLAELPSQPSIVFVRYAPRHSPHHSLVQNDPDSAARFWIVHDLGADNQRLLSIAPDRRAYLYSEALFANRIVGTIRPMLASDTVP
jgi:hypothetical protein